MNWNHAFLKGALWKGTNLAFMMATIVCPLSATQVMAIEPSDWDGLNENISNHISNNGSNINSSDATIANPTVEIAQIEISQSSTPAPAATPSPRFTDNSGLYERVEYINACRRTNQAVEIFADTALSPVNRVGSLGANAEITLTGVLAPGRAQIIRRESSTSNITVVGWVNAAYLTTCGTPPSTGRACYRINTDYLTVRTTPSSTSSPRGSLRAGTIVYATTNPPTERTSPNTYPDYGRIWAEISFEGAPGWIARTGQNGQGSNATLLSATQCNP